MTRPTVKLRPLAEVDLADIYRYTRGRWGRKQAVAYVRNMNEAFLGLLDQPASGQDRSELKLGLRSLQQGSHVIFYRHEADGIVVIRVLHQSMDVQRHF